MNKRQIVFFLFAVFFTISHVMANSEDTINPSLKTAAWPFNTGKLQNVVTVSPNGGDFTDPVTAINSITDAESDNPYLVVIGPGVYTLSQPLIMKSYVSIRGAGEKVTKLTGAISDKFDNSSSAIITGTDNATLSDLTVENVGGSTISIALYNLNNSLNISSVTLIASGGTYNQGVYNHGSSPVMTNVTATASGGTNSYGVQNYLYSSPIMTNVIATAYDGTLITSGVYNYYSQPIMNNVTATGSGGTHNRGVYNSLSYAPVMTNVIATGSGGTHSRGVYNYSSYPVMTFVTATGLGGTTNSYGVYNSSSSPIIRRCWIEGETLSMYINGGTGTTYVMQSSLIGGVNVSDSGTLSCVTSNNGIDTSLDSICNVP